MLATTNGVTKFTPTRTQVTQFADPPSRMPPWLTAVSSVPTTAATGPATRTVAPRANGTVACGHRDHVGFTRARRLTEWGS